jgi:hypothetical protein
VILKINGDAAFPSLLKLNNAVNHLSPEELKNLKIDLSDASLIDHTFLSGLHTVIKDYVNPREAILGIEGFKSLSAHPEATHVSIR